jgi:hypothetical protein
MVSSCQRQENGNSHPTIRGSSCILCKKGKKSVAKAHLPSKERVMKKEMLATAIFLMALALSHPAAAFSTEQGQQNSDGSAKYTDPDDQKPGFVTVPSQVSSGGLSFSAPSPVTLPSLTDSDRGAQAFDQAFAHQQNK